MGPRLTSLLKSSPTPPPLGTASLWMRGASESCSLSGRLAPNHTCLTLGCLSLNTHSHGYLCFVVFVPDVYLCLFTRLPLSTCLSLSLGGYPPFHESFGGQSITDQIIRGEFTMVQSKWRHVSDQGTVILLQYCSITTTVILLLRLVLLPNHYINSSVVQK